MLNKHCAIITGGASGIGKQLTIKLVTLGVNVVFGDINKTEGIKLQEDVKKTHPQAGQAIFKICDVRNLDELESLFSTATEQFGGAQIVVNNAGIFPKEDIENKIDVTLKATYIGTSLAIKHFRRQKEDSLNSDTKDFCIINLSSVAACNYFPSRSVYSSYTPMIRKAMEEEPEFREAVEKTGVIIPPMRVVEGILELINNAKYAGEALFVGQDDFTFLPKL